MAVPFGSLIPQRSRVLPQGGAVLGQLTGTFQQGLEQGRARAAEDAAPNDLMNYLDTLGANYQQPRLGALAPTGAATGYVAGEGTAPTYNGTPTRENAATQAALTPGDPTFDGRYAMRRENASQQNPPAPAAPYATNIAGYGSGLNTTGLDPTFGTGLDSAIQAYIAAGGDPATVQINSLVRSTEEQQRLYDQYQRGEIGLAAPPGSSRHEYGAAADIQSGPFLDWLTQNANQYGLSFLQGNAYAADPGHVQLAGPSPAGTRAPAIPAGSTTQAAGGGGYSAQPAWSPPTGAERQALRALIMNPATREMGMQLAIERMTPPAPTTPNYGFTEVGGVLYRTDPQTGQAAPVTQAQAPQPDYGFTNVPGVGLVRTDATAGTAQPLIAAPPDAPTGVPDAGDLRTEIRQLQSYKNYYESLPIYQSMVEAFGTDTKVADLNLVYGLAKIFDPTSVVREGEQIMVRNTASLPDWLIGTIDALNGGGAIEPATRSAIMEQARSRVGSYQADLQNQLQFYNGIAQRANIAASDLYAPLGALPDYGAPTAPTPAGNTLVTGGLYTAPDGRNVRWNGTVFVDETGQPAFNADGTPVGAP